MPYYSIAAQLLVHAILYRYSAWQIGELPQVANAGPPCPHSWQAHGQAWPDTIVQTPYRYIAAQHSRSHLVFHYLFTWQCNGNAMLTGEDEGETNTNSLVVQWRAAQLCHAPWGDRGCDQSQLLQGQRWAFVHCWHIAAMDTMEEEGWETNTNSLESMTSCPTLPMFEVLWIERGGNAWPFSPSCFLSSPTTKASSIPRWRRFWQDLWGVFVQGGQLLQRGLPLQARVVGCQPELTPSPPSVSLWTTSLRSSLELRWGRQVSIDFYICQYWDLILHRLLAPATLNLEPGQGKRLVQVEDAQV